MPGKRARLLPLLLPALVCIPIAAAAVFLLVDSWQALDARSAAQARASDAALRAQAALSAAVQRQTDATGLLSRSPLVWLWVKFQGERLTASNRSHADTALADIENYARLVPGMTVYLASAKTGLLYRDGAPVRTLRTSDPQDAWYFDALGTDALLTVAGAGSLRTSARIMNGASLLGAVSCVRSIASIAADVFPPGLATKGLTTAIVDAGGAALAVSTPGSSSVRTARELVAGAGPSVQSELPAPAVGGSIIAAAEIPAVPITRVTLLAVVPAACLALIVAGIAIFGIRGIGRMSALLDRQDREGDSTRTGLVRIRSAASSAQSAAQNLRELAVRLGAEAAAGLVSAAETARTLAGADAQAGSELPSAAERLSLVGQLVSTVRAAVERSRGSDRVGQAVATAAATAEAELGRTITLGASAAGAIGRAAHGADSLVEATNRLNLLAVNAALEAVRAGPSGQGIARIAEEVRGLAEDAARRVKLLAASLSEAGDAVAGSSRAAQDAGRAAHDAAAAAAGCAGGWEEPAALLERIQAAGAGPQLGPGDMAAKSDRERSAVEGIRTILERIRGLAGQAADLAGSVTSDMESAAQTAAAITDDH
jgi:methyl-accepting chemotaxis protein